MVESVVQSHAEIVVDSDEKKLIRVLHVDDELGLLKVAKQCLELQGPFHVDTAGSVEEALNKLKEKEYDAVVSDYQMPGEDGLEFLEMLRKNGNTVPFIMFTGKGREEVAVKAWGLGADHYVNKIGDPETVYCELAHCLRSTVEKRFAEAQMKETVQRLQTIYQNAVEGITYVDAEENIVYANKAFADIVGYERDQLAGMNLRKTVDDENWARIECETKRRRQGESSRYEVEFRRRDGTVRNALISGAPFLGPDGRYVGTVGIVLDITDRIRWEGALRDAKEKWASLTENTDDIVMIVDGNGTIQFINRTIPPYTPEETIGKTVYEYVPREQHDVLKKSLTAVFKTGKPNSYEVSSSIPKIGTMWFRTKVVPVRRDGKVSGAISISANVTESKKAEKETESVAKFPAQNPEPVLRISSDGTLLYANQASQNMLNENQSKKDRTLIETLRRRVADALSSNEHSLFEEEHNGRIFQFNVVPVASEGYANLYATDITERKHAEQTLKESEEKYRSLVELAPDGIIVLDLKGTVTSVNNSLLRLIGYDSKEEIVGKPFTNIKTIRTEDIPRFQEMFSSMVKGELLPPVEFFYVRRDGTSRWAEVHPSLLIEDGNPVGLQVIMRDVSERKKAEQGIRIKDAALASSIDAVVFVDHEGNLTYVNDSFLRIWGYANDKEVLGRPAAEFWLAEEQPVARSRALKALNDGEGWIGELTAKKKDGSTFEAQLSVSLVKDEIGKPVCMMGSFVDVTERKKIEEKLRDSEERLNTLFELAPDAYYLNDLKGKFMDGNKAAEEVTGYTKNELIGKSFLKLKMLTRSQALKAAKLLAMNALGKPTGPDEFVLNRKDGTQVPVEIRTYPVKIKGKTLVLGIARDITIRKKDQQAILESRQKFEGLFRHNPEAAVYLDVDFRILDVNPRFCELFGYSAEEVKGKNIDDFVAPEDLRVEAESLNNDAKNGYASHDTVRKRKDGSLVPVSISAAPVTFENKLLGYVGIYKDITELKRAQAESEESRRHFQMLFDLMADPVAVVDGRGKILEVTQKVEEITGFKKEELVGKNLLKVEMFGAKTKAVMIKSLAKRMMGMHVEPYEVEVLKKDGGKLLYEINAAKIDYRGKPADLVVFRDILERKNLEEKLRVVGSLTRHDVRNKLSAVTGNAYLLRRKLAGNPEALEQLAGMENAVRKVEAIFEFARTYEKLGVEQLVNVNVGKAVDEAIGLFPDLKGVKIANECLGLTVLADSLLRQLFYNLIDDSLKYGEKLTQIRIRYEKSENQLKLVYEDDGVGISKDAKAKLFTEGFSTGKGSGYGLYLIKRMMEVYGWTVNETGVPGKGAQFTINIPEAKPDGRQNYKLN